MEIITPKDHVGTLMELCQGQRGEFIDMQFLTETRTTLIYELPLANVHTSLHLIITAAYLPVCSHPYSHELYSTFGSSRFRCLYVSALTSTLPRLHNLTQHEPSQPFTIWSARQSLLAVLLPMLLLPMHEMCLAVFWPMLHCSSASNYTCGLGVQPACCSSSKTILTL